jgi:hypothetical protein
MVGTVSRANFPAALQVGINKWIRIAYDEYPMQCNIAFTDAGGSSKAYEETVAYQGLGLAEVKAEGAAVSFDSHQQGYKTRFTHMTYGKGVIVTREEVDDNQYMELGRARSRAVGFAMRQTRELVAASVYINAFDSNYLGGDGASMISTSHPSAAGNWANRPTNGVDLSDAAIEDANTAIMAFTDDRGLRISVRPRRLIVPRGLWGEAKRITQSEYQPNTANNAINVINGMFPEETLVYQYLTDEDAWFILTSEKEGVKYFTRRALEVDRDNDFSTQNMLMMATERYSYGWDEPRGIYGSPGA